MAALQASWKQAWAFVRHLSGDDRYERYLCHHRETHPGEPPLSREEFFARQLDHKWNSGGVSRCC